MRSLVVFGIAVAIPLIGIAQPFTALDVNGKLDYQLHQSVGPWALAGDVAYAGVLQGIDSPKEWGQGWSAYGQRLGSTMASSGIHSALAFGLGSILHQDPRYFRSGGGGFWNRAGHALRGTVLTRTDSGAETFSVWRFGSAYGAAYLSNQWYPSRANTVGSGLSDGSLRLAFDLAKNLACEFAPDLKRKLLRRKP